MFVDKRFEAAFKMNSPQHSETYMLLTSEEYKDRFNVTIDDLQGYMESKRLGWEKNSFLAYFDNELEAAYIGIYQKTGVGGVEYSTEFEYELACHILDNKDDNWYWENCLATYALETHDVFIWDIPTGQEA